VLSCFCVILFRVFHVIGNVLLKDQQMREPSYGRYGVAGLKVLVKRSGKCTWEHGWKSVIFRET
jgi:hypothetical protein